MAFFETLPFSQFSQTAPRLHHLYFPSKIHSSAMTLTSVLTSVDFPDEVHTSKAAGLMATGERKNDTLVLLGLGYLTQNDSFQFHPLTSKFHSRQRKWSHLWTLRWHHPDLSSVQDRRWMEASEWGWVTEKPWFLPIRSTGNFQEVTLLYSSGETFRSWQTVMT